MDSNVYGFSISFCYCGGFCWLSLDSPLKVGLVIHSLDYREIYEQSGFMIKAVKCLESLVKDFR